MLLRRIARRFQRASGASLVPFRRLVREPVALTRTLQLCSRTIAATKDHARTRRAGTLVAGIDIGAFYEPLTGIGWYLAHLVDELAKVDGVELVLFGEPARFDHSPPLHRSIPAGARWLDFDFRRHQISRWSSSVARGFFPLLVRAARCDVFFAPNYFLPRRLSAVARKRVITIHDLTYQRHPELLQDETLRNLEQVMTREVAKADAIITVSNATRNDVLAAYDADPARVVTVYSGVHKTAGSAPPAPEPYLLFVSTIEPRKDLDTLITAYETLRDRGTYQGDLVVVGRIGWKASSTVERMRTSRWAASIRHLEYLMPHDLTSAYRRAEIFVFPSLYEGFGFPLLESMAHGVPSIAANTSSLPEVGGDAALYFTPGDAAGLAGLIEKLSNDDSLKAELVRRGLERVEMFDWSRCARETLSVFRSVAGAAE